MRLAGNPYLQIDLATEATEHKPEFTEKDLGGWFRRVWIHLPDGCRSFDTSDTFLWAPLACLRFLCTTKIEFARRLRGFFSSSYRNFQEETESTDSASIQKSNSTTDFSADFADGRGF
jgi:hypothetical protein